MIRPWILLVLGSLVACAAVGGAAPAKQQRLTDVGPQSVDYVPTSVAPEPVPEDSLYEGEDDTQPLRRGRAPLRNKIGRGGYVVVYVKLDQAPAASKAVELRYSVILARDGTVLSAPNEVNDYLEVPRPPTIAFTPTKGSRHFILAVKETAPEDALVVVRAFARGSTSGEVKGAIGTFVIDVP